MRNVSAKDEAQIELGADLFVELLDNGKRYFVAKRGSDEERDAKDAFKASLKKSLLVMAALS